MPDPEGPLGEGGASYRPSEWLCSAVACPQPRAGTAAEEHSDGCASSSGESPWHDGRRCIKCTGLTCEPRLWTER